jgi:hypothetical protein
MRIEWIGELRKTISEYHSILMTRSEWTDDGYLKLSDLGTQLDLLLNVDDPAQKAPLGCFGQNIHHHRN